MVTAWLHCGSERPHAEHNWFERPFDRPSVRCCGTEAPQYGTPGNRPLVDLGTDVLGLEWGAALYESYAADNEWSELWDATNGLHPDLHASGAYAETAHGLCEEMEADRWESIEVERLERLERVESTGVQYLPHPPVWPNYIDNPSA